MSLSEIRSTSNVNSNYYEKIYSSKKYIVEIDNVDNIDLELGLFESKNDKIELEFETLKNIICKLERRLSECEVLNQEILKELNQNKLNFKCDKDISIPPNTPKLVRQNAYIGEICDITESIPITAVPMLKRHQTSVCHSSCDKNMSISSKYKNEKLRTINKMDGMGLIYPINDTNSWCDP
jgi:DNA gyrase/topoisomerase IV subunit A